MHNLAIRKLYISTPPSPEVEYFQMKIYYPVGDLTTDLLNQRQTCYHQSQRGELLKSLFIIGGCLIFTDGEVQFGILGRSILFQNVFAHKACPHRYSFVNQSIITLQEIAITELVP